MNQVNLIGNVGAEPETRYTQGGDPIVNVRLATTERWKKDGEKQEKTEWHRVTFFGGVAKVVQNHVSKGDRIAVTGKIHYSEYEKDGVRKFSTEIHVGFGGQLELLGGKPKAAGETVDTSRGPVETGAKEGFQATDDDVPF